MNGDRLVRRLVRRRSKSEVGIFARRPLIGEHCIKKARKPSDNES